MKLRVLLVENNALNLELHRDLLEVEGHEVRSAESAAEFREQIGAGFVPDVVVMDILLNDGIGTDLLPRLRCVPSLVAVPVVAVTAQALEQDIPRLLAAGFSAVITKPIDTRTFAAEIARWAPAIERRDICGRGG